MPRLCVAFLSLLFFACAGPSKGEITFPAAYVRNGVEKALQAAGGSPAGKAPANLAITITQIAVEEKTFYNAEFTGRISLDVVLTRPISPEPCWSSRVSGSGRNYGKAGNPTNYQETLNRALDDAT